MPLAMRLTVVSWPAISSSLPVATTSCGGQAFLGGQRRTAGPVARLGAEPLDQPGHVLVHLRGGLGGGLPAARAAGSSAVMIASAQGWKRGSSSCGTPSCRQITVTGKG